MLTDIKIVSRQWQNGSCRNSTTTRAYCDAFDRTLYYHLRKPLAKGVTAWFCLQRRIMNFLKAQTTLEESIKLASCKVKTYLWQLSGDQPNSFCRFFDIGEEDLTVVFRLCKIYIGEKDNFSKNNFELTMSQCGCDWPTYRLRGKLEDSLGQAMMA